MTRLPSDDGEFDKLKGLPKGTPWAQRADQIYRYIPGLKNFDWQQAFREDTQLFADIYRGILGLEGPRSHTWGPRSLPSVEGARERIRQWQGEDYTTDTFDVALTRLSVGWPQARIAKDLALSQSTVSRLLNGKLRPDVYTLTAAAKAFNKQPDYFLEYRVTVIFNALWERMNNYQPEASISIYRKIIAKKAS